MYSTDKKRCKFSRICPKLASLPCNDGERHMYMASLSHGAVQRMGRTWRRRRRRRRKRKKRSWTYYIFFLSDEADDSFLLLCFHLSFFVSFLIYKKSVNGICTEVMRKKSRTFPKVNDVGCKLYFFNLIPLSMRPLISETELPHPPTKNPVFGTFLLVLIHFFSSLRNLIQFRQTKPFTKVFSFSPPRI